MSSDYSDDDLLESNAVPGQESGSLNPMQMKDIRCDWKETQTEVEMLLGDHKSRYDGSCGGSGSDVDQQRLEFEADMARQCAEVEARCRELSAEHARQLEAMAKERQELEAAAARQRRELADERERMEEERQRAMVALQEAERKRLEALKAADDAELKRKEAAAGLMFQKALSRQSLTAAQHKKEEVEAAEHHAEELLREAEQRRQEAEELEHHHREEIAAMKAMKEELDNSMTEPLEFVKNKAELSPAGLEACRKLVPILLRNRSLPICIDGHTNCFLDKCKDHCMHLHLSQQRVDAVKEQLRRGGAHNNILTKGWGCKHPELKNVRAVRIYPAPKDLVKISKMTSL